ncbi:DUF6798 domain-containing protein [Thioclava sp. GXIMD4216]|uniref:DUF6798 domain-containing protein n=1 Tax=unclassified Thioclava TaxID=2621713 RepID=UPI0030D1521D
MRLLTDPVARSGPAAFLLLWAAAVFVLVPEMWRMGWSGNEVNYFDLAWAHFHPELSGPDHAVRDASQARVASFAVIGSLINLFGFDGAKLALLALCLPALALGYSLMARAFHLSLAGATVALVLFVATPQSLFGQEWLFQGVEAKVLAYVFIFPGLAVAWSDGAATRMFPAFAAALCLALATWMHFLVGGFWMLVVLGMFALGRKGARGRRMAVFFAIYLLLTAPLVWIILSERMAGGTPDMAGLSMTLNQIYAVFRNPHHLAPFVSMGEFAHTWFPGVLMAAVIAALAFGLARQDLSQARDRRLMLLVACLNLYLVLAVCLAFLDRETQRFGMFYMFRPGSLILLLSFMAGLRWITARLSDGSGQAAPQKVRRPMLRPVLAAFLLAGAWVAPQYLMLGYNLAHQPVPDLAHSLSAEDAELVAWMRRSTPPEALFLIAPAKGDMRSDADMPRLGLERLSQRATLVNWKFVPTTPSEIIRWYRLLQLRQQVFAGDCAALGQLPTSRPVDYLVIERNGEGAARDGLQDCTRPVWSNARYRVLQTLSAEKALAAVPSGTVAR